MAGEVLRGFCIQAFAVWEAIGLDPDLDTFPGLGVTVLIVIVWEGLRRSARLLHSGDGQVGLHRGEPNEDEDHRILEPAGWYRV